MIDGKVGCGTTKRDKIASYQTSIGEDLGCRGGRDFLLVDEVPPTDADGDGDDDKIGKPLPSLPKMQEPIAQQRKHEAS